MAKPNKPSDYDSTLTTGLILCGRGFFGLMALTILIKNDDFHGIIIAASTLGLWGLMEHTLRGVLRASAWQKEQQARKAQRAKLLQAEEAAKNAEKDKLREAQRAAAAAYFDL